MTERRNLLCTWAVISLSLAAFWIGVFDAIFGGLSAFGAGVALVFVGTALGLAAFIEATASPPPATLADCVCPRALRYGRESANPASHRPSCPYRLAWERSRREKDCGCGPPLDARPGARRLGTLPPKVPKA